LCAKSCLGGLSNNTFSAQRREGFTSLARGCHPSGIRKTVKVPEGRYFFARDINPSSREEGFTSLARRCHPSGIRKAVKVPEGRYFFARDINPSSSGEGYQSLIYDLKPIAIPTGGRSINPFSPFFIDHSNILEELLILAKSEKRTGNAAIGRIKRKTRST
jgi:hypothetical protein